MKKSRIARPIPVVESPTVRSLPLVELLARRPRCLPLAGARSPLLEEPLRRQVLGDDDDGQARWVQQTA
jgi:hypothetical protein